MSTLQPGWLRPDLGNQLLALESQVGPMAMLFCAMWYGSVVWEQVPVPYSACPVPRAFMSWTVDIVVRGHSHHIVWKPRDTGGRRVADPDLRVAWCISLVIPVVPHPPQVCFIHYPRHRLWLQMVLCLFVFLIMGL